jgi:hypothetical protein
LYVCALKFMTSISSFCKRRSHTGCPSLSRIMHPSCPGPASSGPFFGAMKMRPGAVSRACVVTSMTGGRRSGRERKFHTCPAADAALARARGAGSQPRVPPSATHAAPPPAACRNLLRVNSMLKAAPLSRYFFAHLPDVTQGTLLHPTPTTASHSLSRSGVGSLDHYPTTRFTSLPGT